jgi:ribosome modulation factor
MNTQYEDTRRYSSPPDTFENSDDRSNADHCKESGRIDRMEGATYEECPYVTEMNRHFWQVGWEEMDKELN